MMVVIGTGPALNDGTRDIPTVLQQTIDANPGVAIRAESGIDETTLREIGASLVNSPLRVAQDVSTPVNHGFNLAGGTRYDMDNGMSIGLIMNAGFSRDFQRKEGRQGDAAIGPSGSVEVRNEQYAFESMTESVTSNALIGTGIEFDDNNSLEILAMALRKTTKEARQRVGTEELSFGGFDEILRTNLEFFENQVWTAQANSEHLFPNLGDLSLNLRASYSEAYRDAPYETEYTYVREDASREFRSAIGLGAGSSSSGFDLRFSEVNDQAFSFGGDFVLPSQL